MNYKSTRNSKIKYNSAKAISRGISEEGGLFVPTELPFLGEKMIKLMDLSYQDRAKYILKLFLTDFTEEEICDCAESAYDYAKFDGDTPAKLNHIDGKFSVLELWHGPTCAFKDMALQILPHLLSYSLKKESADKEAVILVATSGDTGKAALEGFKDVDSTKIMVFYPENGVSAMQLRQMNTQEGNNLTVCAVEGNFDDCQTAVKQIFTNDEIKNILAKENKVFSSANSINWGRLLPQIIYYISAYLDMMKAGKVKKFGEKINFVVPTGNFGNILAAYYAKRMGLPVNKLICASNSNNVLSDFIKTGTYDKDRKFYTTVSPSMDILVSSNLERLLYHISGEKSETVTNWMTELNTKGSYTVDAGTAQVIKDLFYADCCDDTQTLYTIKNLFEETGYLCDTHTAVAVKAYEEYKKATGDTRETIVVSTASPYKFAPDVLSAVSENVSDDEFIATEELAKLSGMEIPSQILELKEKEARFNNLVSKETISNFVLENI